MPSELDISHGGAMAGNFKTDFSARGFLHCGDEDRA
jgi:hypothetical protein